MTKKRVILFLTALLLLLGMCATMVCPVAALDNSPSTAPLTINAKAAVLIDAQTGRILYEKNAHERLPMASTTKIMTALLTLEQVDLDDYFTVNPKVICVEGSSMGLREGDKVSLRTLAYGMLLPSGNDAANTAAVKIAGSLPEFAEMMNARAVEMGLGDTHFVTPSGLNDDNHYSTAYDMARLAQNALQNPDFTKICSTSQAVVQFGNPPKDRWLKNHNRLLRSYEGTIGVKTGFTEAAGRCLVSCAERNGIKLIAVTLNCYDDWNVHSQLFDRYFTNLSLIDVAKLLPKVQIPVMGGSAVKVRAECETPPKLAVLVNESVTADVTVQPYLYAPVEQGRLVGTVTFRCCGKPVLELPLTTVKAVKTADEPSLLDRLLGHDKQEKLEEKMKNQ